MIDLAMVQVEGMPTGVVDVVLAATCIECEGRKIVEYPSRRGGYFPAPCESCGGSGGAVYAYGTDEFLAAWEALRRAADDAARIEADMLLEAMEDASEASYVARAVDPEVEARRVVWLREGGGRS